MELSKNYIAMEVEQRWYQHWIERGYFKSLPDNRKAFTVVMPPPNVTGVLHMGHTLNATVQDILVRNARMNGFNACWVPGSDHASIATEAKVVEMLKNEKGLNKKDLTREEFLNYAFKWKEKYGNIIYNQIAKLGCSVDWDRLSFTMDKDYYSAVIKVFVDLFNKGLIYRGARMINWDPAAQTALSDEEVEYKDVTGILYYIKYKLERFDGKTSGEDQYIVIATQRPETIMGDSAVCANPSDTRYSGLVGRSVFVPLIDRKIPVIFDDYVDKDFGTGILKITPAHDINDYNLGLKHKLEVIDTLNDDGTLATAAQIHIGTDRFVARKLIIKELKEKGCLVKEEQYATRIGYSQRTNVIAEPKISTQWFVKMKDLASPALTAVIEGDITIHPGDKFLATYKYWLENVQDWCISRQLWWGQQIPAWYDKMGNVYVAETEEEAQILATKKHGLISPNDDAILSRDEDVLDTWFSSWLWPIEVFKGISSPGNKDIEYYYPTAVLVTGQDIIFFWVARMIMAGMTFMNEKPFSDVYFTGMVRDNQGRKMSKQLGNSPDLLELIEKYGADAIRFGIMISSPAGNDLLFDVNALEQGRHFNNKLWNALKLLRMWKENQDIGNTNAETPEQTMADEFALSWFSSRLAEARLEIELLYENFKVSEALKSLYSLIWDDFCSWYLEWVKPAFGQLMSDKIYNKSVYFFEQLLQLLHPFMPFITEEIFHLLREQDIDLIIKQADKKELADPITLNLGIKLTEIISAVRDAKNKNNIKPKEKITIYIDTQDINHFRKIETLLVKQVNADKVIYTSEIIPKTLSLVIETDKIYLQCENFIETGSQKVKLLKDLEYLKGFLNSIDKKLNNLNFVSKAKPEIIELEMRKKSDTEERILAIQQSLK